MFAHAKGVPIVICVLLCTLMVMGGRSNAPAASRARQAPSSEVPADAGTVLVEAFVVEVNLPALAELGVSPIGEEPHAVSVADLLKCLDSGRARVIAGAKAASRQGRTDVQARRTTYVGRKTGNASGTEYNTYESGVTLVVSSSSISDAAPAAAVSVDFAFSGSLSLQKTRDTDAPPDRATWEWSGTVALEPGRPAIVAATQSEERAVFLLLTAHIAGE